MHPDQKLQMYRKISEGEEVRSSRNDSCISPSKIEECPRKTFMGINNLVNLRRLKLHKCSWTLVSLIVIITLALVLEASSVEGLPTQHSNSKSRRHHHHQQNIHHHHHRSKHHHHSSRHRAPEFNEPAPDSSGSLSIVTPLDVLRQNMLMEMHKTRLRHQKERRVASNKEFLDKIGR